jgi:hypothetical protein
MVRKNWLYHLLDALVVLDVVEQGCDRRQRRALGATACVRMQYGVFDSYETQALGFHYTEACHFCGCVGRIAVACR